MIHWKSVKIFVLIGIGHNFGGSLHTRFMGGAGVLWMSQMTLNSMRVTDIDSVRFREVDYFSMLILQIIENNWYR